MSERSVNLSETISWNIPEIFILTTARTVIEPRDPVKMREISLLFVEPGSSVSIVSGYMLDDRAIEV
jgi:hypothetical protein